MFIILKYHKLDQLRIIYISSYLIMGCLLNRTEPGQRTVNFHRQNNQSLANNHVETTKYTWYSFLPKAILLQFVRPANFVYLISAVLQSIKVISSLNPITAVAPFVFVIGISLIREGYQDYRRYQKDKQINERPTTRLINGQFVTVKWTQLCPGDIVKVKSNEKIPVDFLLLYTSGQNSLCYVETANLDGQTNLKAKFVFDQQLKVSPAQFESLGGKMVVDQPNSNLHEFTGLITIQAHAQKHIDFENLLLRETVLKNTEQVVGVVVYAGYDTKIVQNQGRTGNKVSHIQRKVNIIQGVLLLVLILLSASCTIGFAIHHTRNNSRKDLRHLPPQVNNQDLEITLIYFSSFLLLTFLIPISLNVSIEVIKAFLGIFLEFDKKMVNKTLKKCCSANNVMILQELGQVDYVLTDKTGTLTANQMIFKHLAVGNQCYNSAQIPQNIEKLKSLSDFHNFWVGLLICHDVVYEAESKKYQGSSPDEVCFISYAKTIGYEFEGRTKTKIFLKIFNQKITYDLLQIIPFNSRKRMSVIVRDQKSKQICIYTKGADSCVLANSIPGPHDGHYRQNITRFAKQGYRTLLFSIRKISDQQYSNLEKQRQQIIKIKSNKTETVEQIEKRESDLIEKYESQLLLSGATAIEDRLQDEVPETIERLQSAGIVVMMITGDKLETAENIGYLSNFIKQLSIVHRFYADMTQQEMNNLVTSIISQKQTSTTPNDFTVIVEGSSIAKFIRSESPDYTKLLSIVSSIIFCRSSPKQKAMIVKHIRKQMKGIVLAIGDGGNDVGMIQAANVGVGILGKQGNSASTASDFSITEFKHLDRLLLHHGRWFYYRLSYFFVFYGWKNLMMTLLLYFYMIDSAFSAASGLSELFITVYNMIIGLVLVVYYSILQQDINDDLYPLAYPELPVFYKDTKSRDLFSYKRYIGWTITAVVISIFIYINTRFSIGSTHAIDVNGHVGSFSHHSEVLAISLSIIVIMVLVSDIRSFTCLLSVVVILVITILGTIAFFVFENFSSIGSGYGTNYMIISMSTFRFWETVLINVAIVYSGKMIKDAWVMLYDKSEVEKFIRRNYQRNKTKKVSPRKGQTFHQLKTIKSPEFA